MSAVVTLMNTATHKQTVRRLHLEARPAPERLIGFARAGCAGLVVLLDTRFRHSLVSVHSAMREA